MAQPIEKSRKTGLNEANAGFAPDPGEEPGAAERSERLRQAVEIGGGAATLSRAIGVPLSSLKRYLEGQEVPFGRAIAIAQAAGVSLEWLATGLGEMRPGLRRPVPLPWDEGGLPDLDLLADALQIVEEIGGDPAPEARIRATLTAARRMGANSGRPPPPDLDARRLGQCLAFAELLSPAGAPRASARRRLRIALAAYRLAEQDAAAENEKPASEAG